MSDDFQPTIIAPRLTAVGYFPVLTKHMNESAVAATNESEPAISRPWSQADLDVFVLRCEKEGLFDAVHKTRQREDGEAWLPADDDADDDGDNVSGHNDGAEEKSQALKMTILVDTEEKFQVQVENATVEFMNQLRRNAWSRLPSMAIETVIVIENNTIQSNDDWLAHRLGLLTLRVDPRLFDFYEPPAGLPAVQNTWTATTATTTPAQLLHQQQRTERDTLVFSIDVQCLPKAGAPAVGSPAERFEHTELQGKDLHWHPVGNQLQRLQEHAQRLGVPFEPPHVVSPEQGGITRLGAGQRIHVIALAQKGTQSMHSHFGPVAAVRFHQQKMWKFSPAMVGDRARKLVTACPKNVFELCGGGGDIEDLVGGGGGSDRLGGSGGADKSGEGVVGVRVAEGGALRCNLCRECTTRPEFAGQVDLRFSRSSFVFTLESNGAMRASEYWKMLLEMYIGDERQRRASRACS